jgi:hypothetical protein
VDATTLVALIAAGGSIATAALSLINRVAVRNDIAAVKTNVVELHLTMNSRLDALLAATKAQAFAEGVAHERAGEADRVATELLAIADAKAKVLDQDKARDG